IGIDAQLSQDGSNTLQTAAFSTTTTSDFLVAFVAYDGPSIVGAQTATVRGSWARRALPRGHRTSTSPGSRRATGSLRWGTIGIRPLRGHRSAARCSSIRTLIR